MPSSVITGKSNIKEWVDNQSDINTIIDIGVGQGTYHKLLTRDDKGYRWVGIEIFSKYVDLFNLRSKYNQIIIGDVSKIELPEGDLIIFGDVLEHIEKEEAIKVLKNALKTYKHLVLSIPVDGREGKIHYGNEHEAHISNWTYKELKEFTDWRLTIKSRGIGVFIK